MDHCLKYQIPIETFANWGKSFSMFWVQMRGLLILYKSWTFCWISKVWWPCFCETLHSFIYLFLLRFAQVKVLTVSKSQKKEIWWWATIFDLVTYSFYITSFFVNNVSASSIVWSTFLVRFSLCILLIRLRLRPYWQFLLLSGLAIGFNC